MRIVIYLFRHGKTIDADEKRYKGHLDVPLSDEGISQIKCQVNQLKQRLRKYSNHTQPVDLDAIYTSDLSRTVQSAKIIADVFNLTPIKKTALKERNFGQWEGMTFDEINSKYPKDFSAWANDPLTFSPSGGESTTDLYNRVIPAFNDILKQRTHGHIVIMGHGGVNRIILCHLLKIPLQHCFRIEQDFAALNVIEIYDNMPVVKELNYTAY